MKNHKIEALMIQASQKMFGKPHNRTLFFKGTTAFLALNLLSMGAAPMVMAGNLPEATIMPTHTLSGDGKTMELAHGTYTWDKGFNIAEGYGVKFTATGTAINKDTSGALSSILGSLEGDKVYILNPNGVLFGANASVNVNGLVAAAMGGFEFDTEQKISEVKADITANGVSGKDFTVLIGQNVTGAAEGAIAIQTKATAQDAVFSVAPNGATITFKNTASDNNANLGEIDVNAKASEVIFDTKGDVTIGNVQSDMFNATAGGSVTVNGTINSAVDADIAAKKDIVISGTASLTADDNVYIKANNGAKIDGTVEAKMGDVDIYTFNNSNGKTEINGTVKAGMNASVKASGGDITVADTASVTATKNATFNAKGDATIGNVKAGTITVTAATLTDSAANIAKDVVLTVTGEATLDAANDFDTIKGTAKNLTVNDADELDLAGVAITETLDVTTGGALTESAANTAENLIFDVGGAVILDNAASGFGYAEGKAEAIAIIVLAIVNVHKIKTLPQRHIAPLFYGIIA